MLIGCTGCTAEHIGMNDNRVIVVGLPPTCSSVKVKLKFEKYCDVKISNLKIAAGQAEVIFDKLEGMFPLCIMWFIYLMHVVMIFVADAEKFCKNIPPEISFGNTSFKISARKPSHGINGG